MVTKSQMQSKSYVYSCIHKLFQELLLPKLINSYTCFSTLKSEWDVDLFILHLFNDQLCYRLKAIQVPIMRLWRKGLMFKGKILCILIHVSLSPTPLEVLRRRCKSTTFMPVGVPVVLAFVILPIMSLLDRTNTSLELQCKGHRKKLFYFLCWFDPVLS